MEYFRQVTINVNARVGGTLGNMIVVRNKEGHGMVDVDISGTLLARNYNPIKNRGMLLGGWPSRTPGPA